MCSSSKKRGPKEPNGENAGKYAYYQSDEESADEDRNEDFPDYKLNGYHAMHLG